jgi:hypothetical protein
MVKGLFSRPSLMKACHAGTWALMVTSSSESSGMLLLLYLQAIYAK